MEAHRAQAKRLCCSMSAEDTLDYLVNDDMVYQHFEVRIC